MVGWKCLPILYLPMTLPTAIADLAGAGQGAGGDPVGDAGEQFLGRGQQLCAFAGAFGRQRWVAAGDQPFAGVVGVGDLGQVLGVEQAHLQRPVVAGELGDRGCAQRGDPPEIGCGVGVVVEFAQRVDAGGGDHAAIAHQHQLLDAQRVADDGDDLGERDRVGGVAGEHAHRDRAPGRVGEHPVLDLLAALLAVAGVAARGQLATPAGHPRAGQVEQRHPRRIHLRGQVFGRELLLDRLLPARPASPSRRRPRRCTRRPRPDPPRGWCRATRPAWTVSTSAARPAR